MFLRLRTASTSSSARTGKAEPQGQGPGVERLALGVPSAGVPAELTSEERIYTPPPTPPPPPPRGGWCMEAFVSILAQSQSQKWFQEVVVYRIDLPRYDVI